MTKYGGEWKGAAGKPGSAGGNWNGEGKGPSSKKKLKLMIAYMTVYTTNKKEQPSTQDEIAQSLLAMVSSFAGDT